MDIISLKNIRDPEPGFYLDPGSQMHSAGMTLFKKPIIYKNSIKYINVWVFNMLPYNTRPLTKGVFGIML
jgi:hypothetical protein